MTLSLCEDKKIELFLSKLVLRWVRCTFYPKLFLFWLLGLFEGATMEEQAPGEGSTAKRRARGRGFCVAAATVRAPQGMYSRPGRWGTDNK